MSNIVSFQDLRAAGATTTLIRTSLECCLLKISRGIYSVVRRCGTAAHGLFTRFIDNEDWVRYHESGAHQARSGHARYLEYLDRLRVLNYPAYRPDDVVWGASAARVHRIGTFETGAGPISIANPRAGSKSSEVLRRKRQIAGEDVGMTEGVAMTSPARTALDLIGALGPAAGFAAMEQVLRRHMLGDDEEQIWRLGYPPQLSVEVPVAIERLFGPTMSRLTRGRDIARRLAGLVSPLSESYAESRASFNLHQLGLHDVIQQYDVRDSGKVLTRLDFLIKDAGVALYVDGTQKYVDGGFDVMNKENRQHNRLLSKGYKVIRFRFSDVLRLTVFSQKLFSQAPELRQHCGPKLRL